MARGVVYERNSTAVPREDMLAIKFVKIWWSVMLCCSYSIDATGRFVWLGEVPYTWYVFYNVTRCKS